MVLDHESKSVVVAIRGSVTSADWITDMLGVPERLDDWIPDSFREVRLGRAASQWFKRRPRTSAATNTCLCGANRLSSVPVIVQHLCRELRHCVP